MASPRQLQAWSAALQWILLAAGASALLALAIVVAQRLPYPFELEWMEGAMVQHAHRVLDGQPVYTRPGVDHVAFLYTPLLYQLGALFAWLPGPAYLPLRLVSLIATLACGALVWSTVRRETGSSAAGAIGAGLFLAGYGLVDTWYDLARNDTLFLALFLLTVRLVRWGTPRQLVAAGGVFCLAFLAKQTALMVGPPLVIGAAFLDWRRALWFSTSAALFTGITVLGYHVATDGWFTWFVFEMPSGHTTQDKYVLGFWTEDLLPLLPMVVLAIGWLIARWRSGGARQALFHAAVAAGLLLASYLSRLHAGGHINVLMFALLGGSLLAGASLTSARPRWRLIAGAACLLQFALLAVEWRSASLLPRAGHRAASGEFVAFLRGVDGEVWVPFHGHLTERAGKPPHCHAQALADALYSGDPEVAATLHAEVERTLRGKRFTAIVLDQMHAEQFAGLFRDALSGYVLRVEPFVERPERLAPTVGMWTHPYRVLQKEP